MNASQSPRAHHGNTTDRPIGTLPGREPGTALRVTVEDAAQHQQGEPGYVKLEQLAYARDMGWYTQKSFRVPAEMVRALISTLNQADALSSHASTTTTQGQPASFPFQPTLPTDMDRDRETAIVGRINA